MMPIINTTPNTPTHTPVLKIAPIAWQLVKNTDNIARINKNLIFINNVWEFLLRIIINKIVPGFNRIRHLTTAIIFLENCMFKMSKKICRSREVDPSGSQLTRSGSSLDPCESNLFLWFNGYLSTNFSSCIGGCSKGIIPVAIH